MADDIARYPYAAPITAYGNGGFRFADMSHRGSILCLPSGISAWPATFGEALTLADFARALAELKPPTVLLVGTGDAQIWLPGDVEAAFAAAGLGLDVMSTGAAARTYNILLAEQRAVAAALIAVA
ncbi:MAG: Mth938-like domain-containing protein [Hyphomicrobium sp.]